MQFPSSFLEQLRNRITLSEIVGKQVRLTRKAGSHMGLCPFHPEKTPSFSVSNSKGFYHCFGCGAHGDAITFLMKKEGMSFIEAVAHLAAHIGMALPEQPVSKQEQEQQQKVSSTYEVMEEVCRWYEQQLLLSSGREALAYFMQRGISLEAVTRFRLGFAPEGRHALEHAMKAKGIRVAQLVEAGIMGTSEKGEHYDRFRGRIIFPIMDSRNRVIAFGGRIIRDGHPKYINSPETVLFKKGEVLYAEHLARKAAYEQEKIIVVEGYMDVIALHMAGINMVVAPLGTALTEQQLYRLWHYAKEPILCLDGDTAGKRAMMRAALLALPLLKPGFSLRFAVLPQGEDPDDTIKQHGMGFMERLIASALPLSDMVWNHEYGKEQLVTPEEKAAFEQRMMRYAETIQDAQVQGYYRRYFSSKIWEMVKRFSTYTKEKAAISSKAVILIPEKQPVIYIDECRMMAVILSYPSLLANEDIKRAFISIEFMYSNLDRLQTAILELYDRITNVDEVEGSYRIAAKDFRQHLEKAGFIDNIHYLCKLLPCSGTEQQGDGTFLWHYALSKYRLSLMKEECRVLFSQLTVEAEQKAKEYCNQIATLEKHIFEKEQLLLNRD